VTLRVLMAVEQLRRSVPGGIGRYASGLLAGLASAGDESADPDHRASRIGAVEVALLASRPPRRRESEESHLADPLARWGLPLLTSRLPGPILTRAWDRGLVTAPSGFDVVHSVSLASPPVRRHASPAHRHASPERRVAALVVTVHDLAWQAFPESTTRRGRRWHEAALRQALGRADALVTSSDEVAEELRAQGARDGTVSVLKWGADHLPAPEREGASALLERLGVEGEYLLSAGTLEPRKNLRRLIAAYAVARPKLAEPWPLVVVGPRGWGDSGLAADPERGLPGAGGVLAAGQVSDGVLAALYERARVFAYVPLTEGYGFPPLEAMTFGVPVVAATGVPSVAPAPGGQPAALRVDPLEAWAIAEALVAAAGDEAVRATLSIRGLELARSRTWLGTARRHVELWESLA